MAREGVQVVFVPAIDFQSGEAFGRVSKFIICFCDEKDIPWRGNQEWQEANLFLL